MGRPPVETGEHFQILDLQSPEPVAKVRAFGATATEITEFLCPWSMQRGAPVAGSQNCTVLSLEPETIHLPSGEKTTDRTKSLWPEQVTASLLFEGTAESISHTLIVLSKEPEARNLPAREKSQKKKRKRTLEISFSYHREKS